MFNEWCFSVELALRSRNINYGRREVELASSLLEGNALLWLIACQEAGTILNNWIDFRNALARTFGPLRSEKEDRLSLFSLRQVGSLEEYIQDFTRLSLSVAGLDEHSRAVLFHSLKVFNRICKRMPCGNIPEIYQMRWLRLEWRVVNSVFRIMTNNHGNLAK